jgi:hypothetical protein
MTVVGVTTVTLRVDASKGRAHHSLPCTTDEMLWRSLEFRVIEL